MKRVLWTTALVMMGWSAGSRGAQPVSTPLTIEALIDIKHPSAPQWSPDGRHVAFTWERAGVSSLYVAAADGAAPPREVSAE